jgi:hypothetical protein
MMKTLPIKAIAILLTLFSLAVADSCISPCNCPKADPYFDYHGLDLFQINPPATPTQTLDLMIQPNTVEYLSQVQKPCGLGLLGKAYACSCIVDGEMGDKYEIEAIKVFADRQFSASIDSTESLHPLFQVTVLSEGVEKIISVKDVTPANPIGFRWESNALLLQLQDRPVHIGVPYTFTVELRKTSGELLTATTQPVVWQ